MTARIDPPVYQALQAAAEEEGRPVSALLRDALADYLGLPREAAPEEAEQP